MSRKKGNLSFELKSNRLSLISFILKSVDYELIKAELQEQFGEKSNYFDNEPTIIDLSLIVDLHVDFKKLLEVLNEYQLHPFAVSNGSLLLQEEAKRAGLLVLAPEVMHSTIIEAEKVDMYMPPTSLSMMVDKPLRSGQQVYARDSDLIVTSLVSYGAEVIADGNIHIYAPLRGRAIAGAQGNVNARIFSTCFEPALYSIAGVFQTTEQRPAENVWGKPVMVHLEDNTLVITPL